MLVSGRVGVATILVPVRISIPDLMLLPTTVSVSRMGVVLRMLRPAGLPPQVHFIPQKQDHDHLPALKLGKIWKNLSRIHLRQDIYYNSAVSYLFWMFLYAGWLLTIGMTSPHRGYDPWRLPLLARVVDGWLLTAMKSR